MIPAPYPPKVLLFHSITTVQQNNNTVDGRVHARFRVVACDLQIMNDG